MNELAEYFRKICKENQEILVIAHPHADPDAIGSVKALGKILTYLGAEVTTGIPSSLSRVSKFVLHTLNESINVDPPVRDDVVVVLDTSSLEQLEGFKGKIENLNPKLVFIDHHHPDEKTKRSVTMYYNEEKTTSTAELILKLGQEIGFNFDAGTSTLMLTGIITDTGHFKFANKGTFKAVASLIDYGADYKEALEALKTPEDPSKKIARLKAAQRLELHEYHGNWIAFSELGAHESDAASMFLKIGADVSLVFNVNKNKIRISSRARSKVLSETSLHLGKLMSKVADHFEGTGGGHDGAAGLTVQAQMGEVKEKALEELKKMLKPRE